MHEAYNIQNRQDTDRHHITFFSLKPGGGFLTQMLFSAVPHLTQLHTHSCPIEQHQWSSLAFIYLGGWAVLVDAYLLFDVYATDQLDMNQSLLLVG